MVSVCGTCSGYPLDQKGDNRSRTFKGAYENICQLNHTFLKLRNVKNTRKLHRILNKLS